MNVIEEARSALDVDPLRLKTQEQAEQIAYRRAVLDAGGAPAARMAAVILDRPVKGVSRPVPRAPKRKR